MRKYEVVIIWETGEKEIYTYDDKDRAYDAIDDWKMAFGNQIQWAGVRDKRN